MPLPIHSISFFFCSVDELLSERFLNLFATELTIKKDVVEDDLKRITKDMRAHLCCCVEYPYIDEYYRDTYYAVYSRKHTEYSRYCFRLSFFTDGVNKDNFMDIDLTGKYFGYIVLRPTPRRVIGYTFLSPLAYSQHNFSCRLCERTSSVMGRSVVTTAFPFCGQDGDAGSCAETTLVMLLDFFSRRYHRYTRLLPSEISNMINGSLAERRYPSRGLDAETAALIMQQYGFYIRTYYRLAGNHDEDENADAYYSDEEFKRLLYIYVESGFPVYTCTADHAFLVIGKENSYHGMEPQLVTIDDSKKPYHLRKLDNEIISFIVPLPEKLFLDAETVNAEQALQHLREEVTDLPPFCEVGLEYETRQYLTTSRSFKNHIAKSQIPAMSRMTIACASMPRFVWVCETFAKRDLQADFFRTPLAYLSVYDATECDNSYNYLLLVKTRNKLIVTSDDGTAYRARTHTIFTTDEEILYPFNNNLKGEHTQWKN